MRRPAKSLDGSGVAPVWVWVWVWVCMWVGVCVPMRRRDGIWHVTDSQQHAKSSAWHSRASTKKARGVC